MEYIKENTRYNVNYRSYKQFKEDAGSLIVVKIERDEQEPWNNEGPFDCYVRSVGSVWYILETEKSHNGKVKRADLCQAKCSKSWADSHTNGVEEYEWFCPSKRDYMVVMATDKNTEARA